MSTQDAQYKANARGLDLVCISATGETPVCKMMDYSRFKYEQAKKEKELKKKQTTGGIGEVQLSLTIQKNDMITKAKTAKRLIDRGEQVRVVMRLKGREVNLQDLALAKMNEFIDICSEFAQVKKSVFTEGRDVKCILEKNKE